MATDFLSNLVQILVNAGVGTDNVNIFRGSKAVIPTGVGPYITITATGGSGPEGTHNAVDVGKPAYVRPNASFVTRGTSVSDTLTMATAAYNAMVAFGQRSQKVQGVFYRSIMPLQEPFDTGVDANNRITFTFNITVVKRPDVATS